MGSSRIDIGYATEVEVSGEGQAIVLVHGTPLNRRSWRGVVDLIAGQGRTVTYDVRGHGSAEATPLPSSYSRLAADLERVLDAIGVERAHVVGHSFGGQIVARFAHEHPERLASVMTVCSRLTPYPPFAAAAAAVGEGRMGEIGEAAIARWFSGRDCAALRYARDCLARADPLAFATALRMISTFDAGETLSSLPVPLLIIAASRDAIVTAPELRSRAAAARTGSFVLVPEAGHMLPLEDPTTLAELLRDVITRPASRSDSNAGSRF